MSELLDGVSLVEKKLVGIDSVEERLFDSVDGSDLTSSGDAFSELVSSGSSAKPSERPNHDNAAAEISCVGHHVKQQFLRKPRETL